MSNNKFRKIVNGSQTYKVTVQRGREASESPFKPNVRLDKYSGSGTPPTADINTLAKEMPFKSSGSSADYSHGQYLTLELRDSSGNKIIKYLFINGTHSNYKVADTCDHSDFGDSFGTDGNVWSPSGSNPPIGWDTDWNLDSPGSGEVILFIQDGSSWGTSNIWVIGDLTTGGGGPYD